MNPYLQMVNEYARMAREGKSWPLGQFAPAPRPALETGAPKVLIFSPHPDDEVIVGGLALRLLRECRWNVINVAVTQGSNKARQQARFEELKACCAHIGFGLIQTAPTGLEKINFKSRQYEPQHWEQCVRVIAGIIAAQRPRVIFFPHALDWNSTHIGTHYLVTDALKTLTGFSCHVVETEYWAAMDDPNLMVEITPNDLADLITALTFHVGEVQRNPYHLALPAWMLDNVRRGGELVGGQGGAAPDFVFATLYRLSRWENRQFEKCFDGGRILDAETSPATLFS